MNLTNRKSNFQEQNALNDTFKIKTKFSKELKTLEEKISKIEKKHNKELI